MRNCSQITQEIEKLNFVKVSFWTKLEIKFHMLMCKACRNYLKDSKSLDRFLHKRQEKIIAKYSTAEKKALVEQLNAVNPED